MIITIILAVLVYGTLMGIVAKTSFLKDSKNAQIVDSVVGILALMTIVIEFMGEYYGTYLLGSQSNLYWLGLFLLAFSIILMVNSRNKSKPDAPWIWIAIILSAIPFAASVYYLNMALPNNVVYENDKYRIEKSKADIFNLYVLYEKRGFYEKGHYLELIGNREPDLEGRIVGVKKNENNKVEVYYKIGEPTMIDTIYVDFDW